MKFLVAIFIVGVVFSQDTKLKSSTSLTSNSNENSYIGKLNSGVQVRKIKLDPTGKYVKISLEAYVPINSLEDATVSLPVGSSQIADGVKYKLLSAIQKGNQVNLKIQVTNTNSKPFDFMALTLLKISASNNKGEMNPFEGSNTVSFGLKKGKTITSSLVYDFKKPPSNVELKCMSKMKGGEKVFFQLGF
ncbi:MAG: hypothetical protein HOB40_05035 [Candidatus Marinimicrobia bacterium]|nr:hypothetical protein [Candidatus Neomarinimicrobiota bacterium]MBT3838980.1 hypothetical protein [Candidatus Neomarinimicrobiota bacterium]MBT3999345.1 hypothetical protein [Candidatus Neomarinimicrobiota bacterium]MBT4282703.1 hypothetical protein [Candidatus Neomarinimicrobiota bacterium]MBT4578267.1 hypothetical protein [Candidatus Neomarinimicrobiota bacterium]